MIKTGSRGQSLDEESLEPARQDRMREQKGRESPVNTGPSKNNNGHANNTVEEADEPARGRGLLQWGPVREMMPSAYQGDYYPPGFSSGDGFRRMAGEAGRLSLHQQGSAS
ncbi:hypothetical protein T02_6023 [Trichinella nativa]|uniref:Uncharacterized protein n=1 Tax=Trichinella nativa TaxID=6335 RepID=A0A0V1KRD5_9BILA|nr:hypothetical protein T02_6023 [Trichinella nativa]